MSKSGLKTFFLLLIVLSVAISEASAQSLRRQVTLEYESPILVRKGAVEISLADFVAYMDRRVPAENHRELISSAARIEGLLENIAVTDAFWNLAQERGMMDSPFFRARLYQAAAREARNAYREALQIEIDLESYEGQAREMYLTEPERFSRAKTVDMNHILVSITEDRSEIGAMKRIIEVHERLMAGGDFSEVAEAFSDDQTFAENQGLLEGLEVNSLVPSLASAVDSLELNEYSMPIQSRFGWHIVRLREIHDAGQMSWEEARPIAERISRERHLTVSFERLLRDINSAPMQFSDGAVRTILEHYGVDGFGIPELGEGSEADDSAQ